MTKLNLAIYVFIAFFLSTTCQAQSTNVNTPWHERLPRCPCKNPDYYEVTLGDGWAKDKGNIGKYHQGAVASFRSYPSVKTPEGKSSQQCCYDRNGDLITSGRGAGTPDKVSTSKGENNKGVMKLRLRGAMGHYFKDVKPWSKLMKNNEEGWKSYNVDWPPNVGDNCAANEI